MTTLNTQQTKYPLAVRAIDEAITSYESDITYYRTTYAREHEQPYALQKWTEDAKASIEELRAAKEVLLNDEQPTEDQSTLNAESF